MSLGLVPASLEAVYGGRANPGVAAFLELRPAGQANPLATAMEAIAR